MSELPRVSFRKSVSDGNYGNESAEVTLDAGDSTDEAIAATLAIARQLVHDELRHSPSWSVTRALEYPKPLKRDEDEEAERWAVSNANAEEHALSGADDSEDLPY